MCSKAKAIGGRLVNRQIFDDENTNENFMEIGAEAPRCAIYVRKLYGWLAPADYHNFRSQYQPDIDYENC